MFKKTYIILLLLIITIISGCRTYTTTKNTITSTINQTTKQSTTLTTTTTTPLSEYIHTLILLPNEAYNEEEANKMVNRLLNIPESILNELINKGVKIKLTTTNITGVPEYAYLSGVTPRGWPSNLTWDDVPGIGGNPVVARIGYSDRGNGHSSINLELHETAHAIDRFVFNWINTSEEFKQIHTVEKEALFGSNAYFNYSEEYFAEVFAMYFLNNQSNMELKSKAPLSHEFIKNLTSKL